MKIPTIEIYHEKTGKKLIVNKVDEKNYPEYSREKPKPKKGKKSKDNK